MADAVGEALAKADKLYVSVDIDVLDPAFAPGTGTPEPGGIPSADLLRMVRQLCREHDVVGVDVVEVAPPYDVSDLTVNAAHRVVFEALGGMAARRRDAAGARARPAGTMTDAPPACGRRGRRALGAAGHRARLEHGDARRHRRQPRPAAHRRRPRRLVRRACSGSSTATRWPWPR